MAGVRARVVVHGRVQGVFFRDTARREALARGVAGWVRNRADGTVEAVFQGDRPAVEEMIAWCQTGPPRAAVVGVDTTWEAPDAGLRHFVIRPD
jgi:acylphosphatase